MFLKNIVIPVVSFVWILAIFAFPIYSPMLFNSQVQSAPNVEPVVAQTAQVAPEIEPDVISGKPRHITVDAVGVDIGIDDGFYDFETQNWSITEEAAFFAVATLPANNQGGNTFIYGHNSDKVFKKLLSIDTKAEAVVTTDTGYTFTYEFKDRQTVKPNDTFVLEYEGAPRIMLQTCTGLLNENRELFFFYLTSVERTS